MKKISLKFTDTDQLIRSLAAHPYRWAMGVCLLMHALFLADNSVYINAYDLVVELFVLQGIGGVVLYKLYSRKKLNFVTYIIAELIYVLAVFGVIFLYSGAKNKMLVLEPVLLLLTAGAFFLLKKKLTGCSLKEQLCSLFIMAAGFTLKLSYSLETPSTERQHDLTAVFAQKDIYKYGHLGYIEYIMKHHHLPDGFDIHEAWQFCHPPLHHIISAVWVSFNENVLRLQHEHAMFTIKTLVLFYTMCIMITVYKLLRHFGLHGKALLIPLVIVNFTPQFVFFSASMNNDVLSVMFIMLAVLFTLEWYDDRTLKRILKIAVCIGLGMMSKMSASLIAPPVAAVFLTAFIRNIKKEWKPLIGQFACFGAVCVPLGLWFGIRNYLKWGIPITYVQELPISAEESLCYVTRHTLMERLFDFSPYQYSYRNIFFCIDTGFNYVEFNPMVGLFKMSVFNEYIFLSGRSEVFHIFCYTLFWLNFAIAMFSVFCKVRSLFVRRGAAIEKKLFLLMFHVVLILGFYKLAIEYPFAFSMNFRYISPIVPIGALFIGTFLSDLELPASGEAAARRRSVTVRTVGVVSVIYAVMCSVMILTGC